MNSKLKRLLIITGTPATGKSTLAKLLEKEMGLLRIDLHKLIESDPVLSSEFNTTKDCYDLDMNKVEELVRIKLEANPGKFMILDSHVSHHLSKEIICGAIVMHCSNFSTLEKRLKARKYSPAKVKENLDCEIFDICADEVISLEVHTIHLDSCKKFETQDIQAKVKKLLSQVASS